MSKIELTEEQRALKVEFKDRVGYWEDAYDEWVKMDPELFEEYVELAAHPWEQNAIPRKDKALIMVALDASVTHLNEEGLRQSIRLALDYGATKSEILDVLESIPYVAMHTLIDGVPLLEEEAGLPEDVSDAEKADQQRVKEKFIKRRGWWNEIWDPVLALDHEFLEKHTNVSGMHNERWSLDPKLKQFIYVAIDMSTTQLYTMGAQVHMASAIEHGATREELMELMELVNHQGYDTMTLGLPILAEEAAKHDGGASE